MGYMAGTKGNLSLPSAPVAGTDEVQTATFGGAPAGSYVLNVLGYQTAPIAWSAVNATLISALQAALDVIPGVGAGGIVAAVGTMTAGVGTATLTFSGANVSKRAQPTITVVSPPSPGTLTIAETTPGVEAYPPGPRRGLVVSDESTGKLLINTGTPTLPVWTVVGTQV
jgi:hypothetical protein